jgi:type III restriction enzyme
VNLTLKGFQELAVEQLLAKCGRARDEAGSGDPQAVILSAPTGSGKTVIVTAVLEALVEGTADSEGDPAGTFLWITDLPELNEQTRRKILATSSVFAGDRLVTLDASFDGELLPPGRIYFLNVQKLREGSLLLTRGDRRTYTIWDTIANTAAARPKSFWVVIDEAHKGMAESPANRERAHTIVQKFIKGSPEEIPSIQLVLGITATPQRFVDLLAGTTRVQRREDITADDVRESGLLKETILLFHPDATQPADITLLKEAATRLQEYEHQWRRYRETAQTVDLVRPILIVQVEDASRAKAVTKTDLAEAVNSIEQVVGPLEDEEIAHAFQEGTALEVNGRSVRYCSPVDIQDDSDLRVVFFKMSLTTGWDCPRVEVMMSFRRAADHTLIAQLVGRMVRTPLARRVDTDEFLNTVSLYLPHYDRVGLQKVIDQLQAADPTIMPAVTVERGEDIVRLVRHPKLASCFEALELIPTYTIGRARRTSNVRRLMKLARLLANDGIAPDAVEHARGLVVGALEQARKKLEKTDRFKNVVKDQGIIDLRAVAYAYGQGSVSESSKQVQVTQENVEDLFDAAGRLLGEGLHKAFWRARVEADALTRKRLAKLELFALVHDEQTMALVEERAGSQISKWQKEHWARIKKLPAGRQEGYHQVRQTAMQPDAAFLRLPEAIQGRRGRTTWPQHLYADEKGKFPYDFDKSSWERKVLKAEQGRRDHLGFLRNEPRKPWSLTVPYRFGGERRAFYPDFVFFRRRPGGLVVDILDPHNPDLDDGWQKAVGLAEYAASHGQLFGRIEVIFVNRKGAIKRLDLTEEKIRTKVLAVRANDQLKHMFGA